MYIILKFFLTFLLITSYIFFHNFIRIFAIMPFWIVCGFIDVSRHKTMNIKLKGIFFGKGIPTFVLSPLNLLAIYYHSKILIHLKLKIYPLVIKMKLIKL